MAFAKKVNVKVTLKAPLKNAGSETSLDFVVYPKDTVASVKERFSMAQAVPFPEQDLVLAGQVLEDNMKIVDCGVKEGATLDFVVRATTTTLAQQLGGLVQAKPMSSDELGFLYAHNFGVTVRQALHALGHDGTSLQEFLEQEKGFVVAGGCVSKAAEKKPPAEEIVTVSKGTDCDVKSDAETAETAETAEADEIEETATVKRDDLDVRAWRRVGACIKDSFANFEDDEIEAWKPSAARGSACEKAAPGELVDEATAHDDSSADDPTSHVPNFPAPQVDVNAWNKVGTRFADCFAAMAEKSDEEESDDEEEPEPQPCTCTVASTDTMPGEKVNVVAWTGVGANIKNALSRIMDEEDSEDEFLPQVRKINNFSLKSAGTLDEEINVKHWSSVGARIHQTLAQCGTEESDCDM